MSKYFLIVEKKSRTIVDLIDKNDTQSLALKFPIKIDESVSLDFFDSCLIAIRKDSNKEDLEFLKCLNPPGQYHPRIFRPCIDEEYVKSLNLNKGKSLKKLPLPNKHLTHDSIQQLKHLINLQEEIFRTIHPDKDNFNCFGMTIRNLLFLSCTELESQFRGILFENGREKERYSTNDFIRLLPIFKLKEYSVKFRNYPWFGTFSPFQSWSTDKPTESLFWYDNYNAVKHDRYKESKKGNLLSALMSIVALGIILRCQFENDDFVTSELDKTFEFSTPNWRDDEKYIQPLIENNWSLNKFFE